MRSFFSLMATSAALAILATACCPSVEAQWGTLKGKVVLKGDVPEIPLLIVKGDTAVKDAAVCGAQDVPDEKLVVDRETKGIANVFVFLAKKPSMVKPELAASKEKEVTFDQEGCRFLPHAMILRTDQQVRVLSNDDVAHNTHTNPIKNDPSNFIVNKDRTGVLVKPMKLVEKTPTKVTCDIHSWMSGYWLIIDHPYAAVTNEKGEFEIADLPVGDHEFKVWQESCGWLEQKLPVTIKDGSNPAKTLEYTAAQILK